MDWFELRKQHVKAVCCLCCRPVTNLYAECIMQHAELDEAKAGVEIPGRSINNLRYAYDTTLTERRTKEPLDESERGELKVGLSLGTHVRIKDFKIKKIYIFKKKKVGLKLNIQKTKIMASGPITSWQLDGETKEAMTDFIFLGSKITADGDCRLETKRH
uniref:Uncharacterized protein n=5 Tax=Ovis aries TaxID=9940 RepID=A0AC11DJC0_SHEEP